MHPARRDVGNCEFRENPATSVTLHLATAATTSVGQRNRASQMEGGRDGVEQAIRTVAAMDGQDEETRRAL